jgi:exopolysaccharide production protein ExoZ
MALLKTYNSVQQLRAAAALGVLIFHVETQVGRMGYEGYWPNFLSSGVDIFFVISGFIMWVTTYGRNVTPTQFFMNRLSRIVPLYWLITAVALLILLVRPEWMQSGALDWPHVLKSFLFIPSIHPVTLTTMEPLIIAGWTLNYELLFYAIFAIALLLPPTSRLLAAIAALVALASIRFLSPEPLTVLWFYSSDIVLEFGIGMLIGWFVTSRRSLPTVPSLLLIALGAILLAAYANRADMDLPRLVVRGIPSAAIVLGAICCELNGKVIRSAFVNYLGDASYSLYLVHGLALSAFAQVWRRLAPDAVVANYAIFTVLAVTLACAAGLVVYELVEKPIAQAIKNRGQKARLAASSS